MVPISERTVMAVCTAPRALLASHVRVLSSLAGLPQSAQPTTVSSSRQFLGARLCGKLTLKMHQIMRSLSNLIYLAYIRNSESMANPPASWATCCL